MTNLRTIVRVAPVASLLLALGCVAEPGDEEDILGSEVGTTHQALGSTKPRVDISTWNGLLAMVPDGNYRLTANINASGKTWSPSSFSGTFDGNGKTISNLTLNSSGDAGFFRSLNQAIVKNLKLTNLSVTGTWTVGGLAGNAQDSAIERIAVEGTITATNGFAVGGIVGHITGGHIYRSYAKGTAQSAWFFAGGLAGFAGQSSEGMTTITESYAQVTVSPNTSDANRTVNAGGIVGRASGADIHDIYAVGNVTGRGGVGGLVGYLDCNNYAVWLLYKGIYRGDVVDKNAPSGGWSGTVGVAEDCSGRTAHLFYDTTLDPSSNRAPSSFSQKGGTTAELQNPTIIWADFYCVRPDQCETDGHFETAHWDAGTSSQHHALKNMPGPNPQPR